ncbi:MAG: DUF3443 family protein [Pseudomonadota bacterium]
MLTACNGASTSPAAESAPVSASTTPNSMSIVIDGAYGSINVPFVSVTVCIPGSTTCQTIDHVLVDTASYGLRVIGPAVLNAEIMLPPVQTSTNAYLGECVAFADGFTWGSVHYADVKLAGEVASNIPIQVIGANPGGYTGIPTDCSGTGAAENTVATLGAKGILGVGMFQNDCEACLHSVTPATYYSCTASACNGTVVTANQMVRNPVASFAQDNNGVMVSFPAVGYGGATSLTGSLVFGIGTQNNNALGSSTVFVANNQGNIFTTYKGNTMPAFIDSGSNAYFFDDSAIPLCRLSTSFYCPPNPLVLTATNMPGIGSNPVASVTFSIVHLDNLPNGTSAAHVGGPALAFSGQTFFDWGAPFFFGKSVFTALEGRATPAGNGPYLAY